MVSATSFAPVLECHTGKAVICADYVTLIRADQRYIVSASQGFPGMITSAKHL